MHQPAWNEPKQWRFFYVAAPFFLLQLLLLPFECFRIWFHVLIFTVGSRDACMFSLVAVDLNQREEVISQALVGK